MSAGYKLAAIGLVAVCVALVIWYRRRSGQQSRWRGPIDGWVFSSASDGKWEPISGASVAEVQAALQAKAAGKPITLIVDKAKGANVGMYWGPLLPNGGAPIDTGLWQHWILDPAASK
jgi:hypothetical protein